MRIRWSVRSLIIRSVSLVVVFSVVLASPRTARHKGCAKHCLGGCKTRGPGKCDNLCKPNYSLQRWSGQCIAKCGIGCLKCIRQKATSYHHCRKCRPGFRMAINPKTGETYCHGGFSSACDPNCAGGCVQKKTNKCDATCKVNYILISDFTCAGCDPNCVPTTPGSCTSPQTCSGGCKSGYQVVADIQQCGQCATGCSACPINGVGQCDAGNCVGNTRFNDTVNLCAPCDPNCASGCTAAGDGRCDGNCVSGYGPTGLGTCGECDPNCDSSGCNTALAGNCDGGCLPGYALSGGSCIGCQPGPYCNPGVQCANPGECTADGCGSGFVFDTFTMTCS